MANAQSTECVYGMATARRQVLATSSVIDENIEALKGNRSLLSRNILAQMRNLFEALIVWAATNNAQEEVDYLSDSGISINSAREKVSGMAKFRLLSRMHGMLQVSTSHYSLDPDPSERLMLKYYEYLLRTRELTKQEFGLDILQNLNHFPLNEDPALSEYYEKIAKRIGDTKQGPLTGKTQRYYIIGSRPFFVQGRVYYEVTFSLAHDRTSKFDRIIGFTDIDVAHYYSANLELANDSIDVLGQAMPIILIRNWSVSIRPCEFDNFARFFGHRRRVNVGHAEYRRLMNYLTRTRHSLLDLIDSSDTRYEKVKNSILSTSKSSPIIFRSLDKARDIIKKNSPGARLLRYLMLRMNNQVLKAQYHTENCSPLSALYVSHRCRPFDTMPFCTSPRRHNPRFSDLVESIEPSSREHELLARRVRNNVEQHGMIYTPEGDLEDHGDIDDLIRRHKHALPPGKRHAQRELKRSHGHVFIKRYENDTVEIIEELQKIASGGIAGHSTAVEKWLAGNALLSDGDPRKVDDDGKKVALKQLFAHSKVAVIYGAAGTGKSTMVNHIANYFRNKRKLFLAHTNPAVDNLKRRVDAPNTHFSTITKHVKGGGETSGHFDVLVIDECSTVSNAAFLEVLAETDFDLLVLVGDVYQIESIEFGNWFSSIRAYIPPESVHELTEPYRTTDKRLLTLWDRVRKLDDRIEESLSKNGYSKDLGESLFTKHGADEIVLCLNYDGLYGINNINRFLQANNSSPEHTWGETIYKVGDPVLFNETERFRTIISNNMKGTISKINRASGRITFDIDLEHEITATDATSTKLRILGDSTVQFDVFERPDSDDDDDSVNTIVPFQIAYAVSIHKAQGLEFDSVKVVITDASEENISHSIFYTAITRARKHLEIYWTPETQQRVLARLEVKENTKDENLLQQRRGVKPVTKVKTRKKVRQKS